MQCAIWSWRLIGSRTSGDRSEIAILIHEQFRRTLYYPNDRRLHQFGAFGETKISIETWPDAASASKAFHGGLVTWVDDQTVRPPQYKTPP